MQEAKVRLRVGHKIQPRQFESFEVSLEVEETIEYATAADHKKAIETFRQQVVADFQRSFQAILTDLGIGDKPVSVTHKTDDGTLKTAALPVVPLPAKKSLAPSNSELDDLFGDDKV